MARFEELVDRVGKDGLDTSTNPDCLLVGVGYPKTIRLTDARNWTVTNPTPSPVHMFELDPGNPADRNENTQGSR